jgi:hypothetical protein
MAHTKNNRSKRHKVKLPPAVNKYKLSARKTGWDPKLTALQNVAKRGLARNPNSAGSLALARGLRLSTLSRDEMLEMVDGVAPVPALGSLSERNPSRPEFFMKPDEVSYLQLLVTKYHDNYAAMQKDIKTNYLQHSAVHLETRCKRLAKWLGEQGGVAEAGAAGDGAMAVEGARKQKKKGGATAAAAAEDDDPEMRAFVKTALLPLRKPALR